MTNKSKQKMKKMNFLSQPRVRVRKQTIEKKNENILSQLVLYSILMTM